ncbi:MAG: YihY family inner membrane protein [Prevotella sp.]|nr:YihY family inner membrane protein [Prevotella sp.]MBQ2673535.1 YihY family inner membrane protein [Prevotella sp.]MBQ3360986.1 YihY family inner membrane protein [Prevotella sp.]MBR1412976.1 YihY family inner membrane protein [Prevotella sp.]
MATKIEQIIRFFQKDIWRITEGDISSFRFLWLEVLKKVVLAIRFFTAKRVLQKASALTYSTLLAIVPISAVVFAIARGFGYNKYIEIWFRNAFESQPQVAEVIIGFVNSYLVHTKSGVFLGIGLIFMLYTVLMLVSNVEDAFNEIWQVKKPRSIFRTFTDYLAMFFVFPIIIVITSGISIFMATIADSMPDFMLLGPTIRFLIDLLPYVLMSGMFIALYVFMPNTHVKVTSAIIPGVLAGIAMQGLQIFYIHAQMFLSGYNAIYGSFAALPLFMLWLQISWTICLFGAELCYTNQNLDYYDYDANTGEVSHRYKIMLATLLMSRICRRFANGQKPLSALELREQTTIPIRFVNELLFELTEAGLIVEITNDEKGETSRYMPAEDLSNLSLGVMMDRLESKGKWKIDLDVSELFTEEWAKALTLRSNFLRDARNIQLKDL